MPKTEIKELANTYCRHLPIHLQRVYSKQYHTYSCNITCWYHYHGLDCNKRTEYYDTLKRKFGKNSCQVMGWVRYTLWGVVATNGTRLVIETSSRGTCHGLDPNVTDMNKVLEATKELHDYLMSKDRWELGA